MMRIGTRSLVLLISALALGGCLDITPEDGAYSCKQTSDCPGNYYCDQPTKTCVHIGHPSRGSNTADMGSRDMAKCDCPPPPGGCYQVTCDNGQCGTKQVPGGTPLPDNLQTPGDCVQLVCNDTGNSVAIADPKDVPVDGNDCTIKSCNGTMPSITPKQAGTPCGSGGFCNTKGQCGGCAPNATQCSGITPQTCTPDGTWLNGPPCTFVCAGGGCTGVCTPNRTTCASNTPEVCNNNGQWVDQPVCPITCTNGMCAGACTPGMKQCVAGNTQETCDQNGKWGSDMQCAFLCTGMGVCSGTCKPNDSQCLNGVTPQTCNADGNWVSGSDCPYVCTGKGQCTGVCKPKDQQCTTNNTPQICDSTGNWISQTACPYVCTGKGICAGSCVPGDRKCNGTQPQTCDNTGNWKDDVSGPCMYVCTGKGICGGSCVPNDTKCDGNYPATCDSNGAWKDAAQPCQFVCTGKGNCTGVCVPTQNSCTNNNEPETCGQDGMWIVHAQCNNSVCINGQCSGSCTPGNMTCNGSQPEKCDANGNYQNLGNPCPFGCMGAGVCTALSAPQPTVVVDGSDMVVSWNAPSFGNVTCHMERSSDTGGTWATPSTAISPCPAGAKTPCNAYDPFLLRGSYWYSVVCTGAGQTARSTPFPALNQPGIQPGIELCATTYGNNSYFADGINGTAIKTERKVSNASGTGTFNNAAGIVADVAKGEIWATSNDSNVVFVFQRTANDPTGLTSSRSFYAAPGNQASTLRPIGIALTPTEVIVVMSNSPYYVAGYTRTFSSSIGNPAQLTPKWYLENTGAGVNAPVSVTTDGNNLIYVGNGGSQTVTVYDRTKIAAGRSTALPPNTVSINTGIPYGLAVDPQRRELFIADPFGIRVDVISADSGSGNPTIIRSVTQSGSPNSGLTQPYAIRFDSGQLYILNHDTGIVTSFPSQNSDATNGGNWNATRLLTADFSGGYGLAICN